MSKRRILKHFDFEKNFSEVDYIIKTDLIQEVISRDVGIYTKRVWGVRYERGARLSDYDSVPMFAKKGPPRPKIADYTFFCCEERLINVQLLVAQAIRPKQPWRIVVSRSSCTVWNGASLLFDFHAYALGIPATRALASVLDDELAVVKRPGDQLVLDRPESWSTQQAWELAEQRRTMRRKQLWTDSGRSGPRT